MRRRSSSTTRTPELITASEVTGRSCTTSRRCRGRCPRMARKRWRCSLLHRPFGAAPKSPSIGSPRKLQGTDTLFSEYDVVRIDPGAEHDEAGAWVYRDRDGTLHLQDGTGVEATPENLRSAPVDGSALTFRRAGEKHAFESTCAWTGMAMATCHRAASSACRGPALATCRLWRNSMPVAVGSVSKPSKRLRSPPARRPA